MLNKDFKYLLNDEHLKKIDKEYILFEIFIYLADLKIH